MLDISAGRLWHRPDRQWISSCKLQPYTDANDSTKGMPIPASNSTDTSPPIQKPLLVSFDARYGRTFRQTQYATLQVTGDSTGTRKVEQITLEEGSLAWNRLSRRLARLEFILGARDRDLPGS